MGIFLVIGLGALIGANLRYQVSLWSAQLFGKWLPYGTFIVNVVGSLILGFFVAWADRQAVLHPYWRLLVAVGFCGAFTTFSSFSVENLALLQEGRWLSLLGYILASNLLCLLGAFIGFSLGERLF